MKKRRLKQICIRLCLVMFLQICPTYAADTGMTEAEIMLLIQQQERAVAANDGIVNGMGYDETGMIDYEDDFAGARIEEDQLVVALTDCSEKTKEKYITWAGEYADALVFEEAVYSYNYLSSMAEEVVDIFYKETGELVTGYYVSEVKNVIVLTMDENTKEMIEKRRANIFYSVPVVYEVDNGIKDCAEAVDGGNRLSSRNTGKSFSVGCCGYFRGVPSIATCAHGVLGIGDQIWVNNQAGGFVGSVTYYNYGNELSGDYAIVSCQNSYYETTNMIGPTYSITGTITSPAAGTYVYFHGAVTNRYCYGLVEARGVTGNNGGIEIYDLTKVKILSGTSQKGDSGGTVFTLVSGTTNAKFAGVIFGSNTEEAPTHMFFTPASFFSAIGFSVKTS